jgi:hypothetical protein
MTMHLAHPALSLTGKKKGKAKFANAEQARKSRALDDDWNALMKKWGADQREQREKRAMQAPAYVPPARNYRGADQPRIPSLNTGLGTAALAAPKVYTGDKIVGIAAMHKSNLVPVFNEEAARDISKMRRG